LAAGESEAMKMFHFSLVVLLLLLVLLVLLVLLIYYG
jgi:heme O synthase-like polyprenyltransferase